MNNAYFQGLWDRRVEFLRLEESRGQVFLNSCSWLVVSHVVVLMNRGWSIVSLCSLTQELKPEESLLSICATKTC